MKGLHQNNKNNTTLRYLFRYGDSGQTKSPGGLPSRRILEGKQGFQSLRASPVRRQYRAQIVSNRSDNANVSSRSSNNANISSCSSDNVNVSSCSSTNANVSSCSSTNANVSSCSSNNANVSRSSNNANVSSCSSDMCVIYVHAKACVLYT